jgi:hypothetical protein
VAALQVSTKAPHELNGLDAVPMTHRQRLCTWSDDPVDEVLTAILYRFLVHTAQWS